MSLNIHHQLIDHSRDDILQKIKLFLEIERPALQNRVQQLQKMCKDQQLQLKKLRGGFIRESESKVNRQNQESLPNRQKPLTNTYPIMIIIILLIVSILFVFSAFQWEKTLDLEDKIIGIKRSLKKRISIKNQIEEIEELLRKQQWRINMIEEASDLLKEHQWRINKAEQTQDTIKELEWRIREIEQVWDIIQQQAQQWATDIEEDLEVIEQYEEKIRQIEDHEERLGKMEKSVKRLKKKCMKKDEKNQNSVDQI